jgi:hypothetical protein
VDGAVTAHETEFTHADIAENTAARHGHDNKAELDKLTDGAHDVRTDNPHQVTAAQTGAIPASEKGAAGGTCDLDIGQKVPASRLPSTIMEFKGTWDVSTNAPELADGIGDTGDIYLVNVAGTRNLGSGDIEFQVGDWIICNGAIWQRSINSNYVLSVNGQQGIVVIEQKLEWELVIEEPAADGQTVPLTTRANGAGHLTRIAAACSAGSCSVKLQIGGVDVPDSALEVGQVIASAALDTGFADGDRVTVVISDVVDCADLELTAHYRQV